MEIEIHAPALRRPVARPLLASSICDYSFQSRDPAETVHQAASQLLNTYVIGPAAPTGPGAARLGAAHADLPGGTPTWRRLRSMMLGLGSGRRSLEGLVPWKLFELASPKWMLVTSVGSALTTQSSKQSDVCPQAISRDRVWGTFIMLL
ncbi:unnamed protein product [Phytophthora fragariaefolia]|uniref:Unnamed protein product n=1 Tax=Phytophthora fragariaefolia TaxID=1490495 RepID=A0A9W7CKY8_9STRA|nr:unnamed protein product [Phytophthora fragariaefolia]